MASPVENGLAPPRVSTAFSSGRLTVAALFGLLSLAVTLPIVTVEWFPSVDLWNHMAIHEAQRQLFFGAGHLRPFYELHLDLYPYWAGYAAFAIVRPFFSPVLSAHIVLALAHLVYVVTVAFFCRRMRVHPLLALLGFAACFSINTWYGFIAYWYAIPVILISVSTAIECMETPNRRTFAICVVAYLVMFEAHIEAYAHSGIIAGFCALVHRDRFRRLALLFGATLPSLLLVLWWSGNMSGGDGPTTIEYVYGPPKDRFGNWQLEHLWAYGWAGMVPALVVGGAGVGLFFLWRRREMDSHTRTTLGFMLGVAFLHFALPKEVLGSMPTWALSLRIGPLVVAAAILGWQWIPLKWARAGVLVVAMLVFIMGWQARQFALRFTDYMQPLIAQLQETKPGEMAVVVNHDDRIFGGTLHHLEHLGALWVIYGAVTVDLFEFPGAHLEVKQPRTLPPRYWDLEKDVDTWANKLDKVLIQGGAPELHQALKSRGWQETWRYDRWLMLARPHLP